MSTIAPTRGDAIRERMKMTLHKFDAEEVRAAGLNADAGPLTVDEILAAGIEPTEVIESHTNLLTYGGASAFWDLLTAGANVTAFNNANAHIGVGNSATAAAVGQTDLQGASKTRKAMDATYPQHTDGVVIGSEDCVFKSTFQTGDANYAWEEWGVFNASTAGRMLQRKVESLGTKTSAAVWAMTVTLSLS